MKHIFKWLAAAAFVLGGVPYASAQTFVRLQPDVKTGTLTTAVTSVTMTSAVIGGFGSVKIQTLDSYSGTWEVQCSLDGITFDTDNELKLVPVDGTITAYNVTDDVGIWDVTNAAGCKAIKVVETAGFAASDTAIVISATESGGGTGGGGGGGGGGTSDTTEATQLNVLSALGATGDAAGTGAVSINAHLRQIATTGIPITSVPSHAVTNAGTFAIQCTSGCTGATTDTDDASIATGQVNANANSLGMVYDGSVWRRTTIGTAGTASAQVTTVQGVASMTPILATLSGTGSAQIGHLEANQSSNVAQINGVTPLMGNGATGTGALRVSIANDSTGVVQPGNTANTTPWLMTGSKTNNNAAPGVTQLPVIPGLANAAVPSYTEGNQVLLSTTLNGVMRTQIFDASGAAITPSCDQTQNTAISACLAGPGIMGWASAATPSAVGADARAQFLWLTTVGAVHIATEGVEDVGETAAAPLNMVGSVRRDVAASSAGTTGDNSTFNTDALGLAWTRFLDPCSGVAKVAVPFSISTATTTQLVAASASNKVYICGINGITAAANNVALVEDDTSACASPTAGMAGGTTAASGWNLAANGGLVMGSGLGTTAVTAATNRYVCFITSAATQLSGTVMYVLAP